MAAYIEMSSGSLVIARTLVTTFRLHEGISGLTGTVRVRPWPTRLAAGAAVFMAGLGLTVLAGWGIHVPALPQFLVRLPPMTRNSAACFLLCGVALLIIVLRGPHWLGIICAGAASVMSLLTIAEYVFPVNLGIDELLGGMVRMAPLAAVGFALGSLGLVLSSTIASRPTALWSGLTGSIIVGASIATCVAFALDSSDAIGLGHATRPALTSSLGLGVFGFGLLALAWRADTYPSTTPRWLPFSVAIAVVTSSVSLWQVLIVGGHEAPSWLLSGIVLVGGCALAPILGLAIYLVQRAQSHTAALRRTEAFLAEAQHLSSTGSFLWRVATDEVTCSRETYRIFQLDHDRPITPALVRTLVHPDDLPLFDAISSGARRTSSDLDYRHRLLMPDGSIKHLHVVARATRDHDGALEYIGAIQDVTESRVSEEALDRARAELAHMARVTSLGALAASIAHEVSQPLSGIITNAGTCLRTLSADPPDIERARETARRAIRDGNRASEVITRLRALFVRNGATTASVDLDAVTREVLTLSRSELQRNRVTLLANLDDGLPAVSGDRVQLQEVILNLLLNAVEAMNSIDDRARHLIISTATEDGDGVRLTVQDAGVGFRPGEINRLFEAFYTTKRRGMGIGLSVSRAIIERHHGHIWATPNDGPGASFSFSLPRAHGAVTDVDAGRVSAATEAAHPPGMP